MVMQTCRFWTKRKNQFLINFWYTVSRSAEPINQFLVNSCSMCFCTSSNTSSSRAEILHMKFSNWIMPKFKIEIKYSNGSWNGTHLIASNRAIYTRGRLGAKAPNFHLSDASKFFRDCSKNSKFQRPVPQKIFISHRFAREKYFLISQVFRTLF